MTSRGNPIPGPIRESVERFVIGAFTGRPEEEVSQEPERVQAVIKYLKKLHPDLFSTGPEPAESQRRRGAVAPSRPSGPSAAITESQITTVGQLLEAIRVSGEDVSDGFLIEAMGSVFEFTIRDRLGLTGAPTIGDAIDSFAQAAPKTDEELKRVLVTEYTAPDEAVAYSIDEARAASANGEIGGMDPAVEHGIAIGLFEERYDEESGDFLGVFDKYTGTQIAFVEGQAGPIGTDGEIMDIGQWVRDIYYDTQGGVEIVQSFIAADVGFEETLADTVLRIEGLQNKSLLGVPPGFGGAYRPLSFDETGGIEGAKRRIYGPGGEESMEGFEGPYAPGEEPTVNREARWIEGDAQRELLKLSPEEIAMVQADLMEAGVIPVSAVRLGLADENTVAGVERAMVLANQRLLSTDDGWKIAVEVMRSNPTLYSQTSGSLPDSAFRQQDIDSLRQTVKSGFQSRLGRDPTEAELERFSAELSGYNREAFDAEQEAIEAAEAGGLKGEEARDLIRGKISEGVQAARAAVLAELRGEDADGVPVGTGRDYVDPSASFLEALESRYSSEIGRNQRVLDARGNRDNLMGSIFRMDSAI